MKEPLIQLIEAYAQNNGPLFFQLCDTHEVQIFRDFKSWTKAPEWAREKEEVLKLYVNVLGTVAEYFSKNGKPELMQILTGDATDNPLIRMENALVSAQDLFNSGEYEASNQIAISLLQELKKMSGSGVNQLYPKVVGLAGNNYLRLGNIPYAKMFTQMAITKCMESGDRQGETIYRKNLKLMVAYEAYTTDKDQLLVKTRSDIVTAQKLTDQGSYEKSNVLLLALLDTLDDPSDIYLKDYLSKIYGLLGMNYYRLNQFEIAKKYTLLALEHAQDHRDRPGMVIYQENLRHLESANS